MPKIVHEIKDPERVLPPNFNKKCAEFYRCLPEDLLPQKPPTGKLSYTLTDSKNRACEIQLDQKVFYVKRIFVKLESDEAPTLHRLGPKGDVDISPSISCSTIPKIEDAWALAVDRMGGWEPGNVHGWHVELVR